MHMQEGRKDRKSNDEKKVKNKQKSMTRSQGWILQKKVRNSQRRPHCISEKRGSPGRQPRSSPFISTPAYNREWKAKHISICECLVLMLKRLCHKLYLYQARNMIYFHFKLL